MYFKNQTCCLTLVSLHLRSVSKQDYNLYTYYYLFSTERSWLTQAFPPHFLRFIYSICNQHHVCGSQDGISIPFCLRSA